MAAIDHSSLGEFHALRSNVNDLRLYNGSDTNYLNLTIDSASSNYSIKFPAEAADNTTLLTDGDDIALSQLAINGASAKTSVDDTDEIAIYDATGLSNKKVTIAHLKSSIEELPSGSSGQLLVHDGSSFAAADVSGDVTCDSTGEFTIAASAVERSMINNDAINGDKIADDAIGAEHLEDGAVEAAALAADCVNGDKIADDSIASEHMANDAVTTDVLQDDCVTSAKLAASIAVDTQVDCPIFQFGSAGTTRFRMKLDASNRLVVQKSTDSGSTFADVHIFA